MANLMSPERYKTLAAPGLLLLLILVGAGSSASELCSQAPDDQWKAPARQAKRSNPVPSDDASITAGKVLYEQQCQSCHGKGGKGDGPAAKDLPKKCGDLSDPKLWSQTDGAL